MTSADKQIGLAVSVDSLGRYVCRREINASNPTPNFYENLGFQQIPESHAGGCPCLEVFGNGYLPALAGGLSDAIKLRPAQDAGPASRATGAGCRARV
jgi:hypothetical protein